MLNQRKKMFVVKKKIIKDILNFLKYTFFLMTMGFSHTVLAGLTASVTLESGAETDIKPGEITTLEIILANNNEANDINDLAFSNVLPGVLPRGLKIAGAANYTCYDPTSSQTIAGSGILTALIDTQAIQLSAGVIPDRDAVSSKDGTCTILIPVTAGTDIGDATNYTYIIADGAVMGDDGNVVSNSGEVKQSINITAIGKPSISKSFSSDTVFLGGAASTLTITIENSETVNVADFSITDTFPTANGTPIIKVANLPNISSTCNNGGTVPSTFSPAAGDFSITASGGTVAAKSGAVNGQCTITVDVVANFTDGHYDVTKANTIDKSTDFNNKLGIEAQADASANTTARSPLSVNKSFLPATLADGQNGEMTIVFSNNSTSPLTVHSFTDSPIDGIGNTTATLGLKINGGITASCPGGTDGSYAVTDGTDIGFEQTGTKSIIAAGGNCTITVPFVGQTMADNTPITYTNTLAEGVVKIDNGSGGIDTSIVSELKTATILVSDTLRILKSSASSQPRAGNPVLYNITIQNWSDSAMPNVEVLDTLDHGMTFLTGVINGIDYTPVLSGTGCLNLKIEDGNEVATTTGDNSADFVIGTIPARTDASTPGACVISFYVMADPNANNNSSSVNTISTGSVCTNNGSGICNGGSVSSTEKRVKTTVLSMTKSFSPSGPLNEGSLSRMTIHLNNYSVNPLSNVSISDTLPVDGTSQMLIATPPNTYSDCGGTVTAVSGGTSIALNGGTISGRANKGAGSPGTCELQVDVLGPAGTYNNTATVTANETYADGTLNPANPIGPVSASADITFNSILSASKHFSPDTISSGGRSTVTIQLTNSDSVSLTGVNISDPLPAGMVVASPANAYTTCSGNTSITATSGTANVLLSGADVAGSGHCELLFDVIATGNANWTNTIPIGGIIATDSGIKTQTPVIGTLNYLGGSALTVAKDTNPGTLSFPGQVSRLTVTINNVGNDKVTNLSLVDYFTADGHLGSALNGMLIAGNPEPETSCSGGIVSATAFASSVSLSNASVNGSSTCTFSVNVTSSKVGGLTNYIPIGAIHNNQGLTNAGQATTSLSTQGNIGIIKQFIPNTLKPGIRGRLRLIFTNARELAVSNLSVVDTLPAGVVIPDGPNPVSNCLSANLTVPDPGTFKVDGGVLEAASAGIAATCYAEIDILASGQGDFTNTIPVGAVTGESGGGTVTNSEPATDILYVKSALVVNKAFGVFTLDSGDPAGFTTGSENKNPGESAVMTIRLENNNDTMLTSAAFNDILPDELFISTTPNAQTNCNNGVVSTSPSALSINLTGAEIPANGNCTVTVNVLSHQSGSYINEIKSGGVTTSEGVINEEATRAELIVSTMPAVSKEFSPAVIPPNGTSRLTIFLQNDNGNDITLSSVFTDTLPGTMEIENPANISTSCPGSVTAVTGTSSITYADSSIIPQGGCTIAVDVTAPASGSYNNSIPIAALQTNLGDNQEAANATLLVSDKGYISGRVFQDNTLVPDGLYNIATDDPILGNMIELRQGTDCSGNLIKSITTDSNGHYLFSELDADTYSVCQPNQPAGTNNSITKSGSIIDNNGSGGTVGNASDVADVPSKITSIVLGDNGGGKVSGSPDNDFSEIVLSSISGRVFFDQNNDGIQNGTDNGIENVAIELTGYTYGLNGIDDNGAGDDTTITPQMKMTDNHGDYQFSGLAPGQYRVTEPQQPAGSSNGLTIPGNVPNGGSAGDVTDVSEVPSIIGENNRIKLPPNTHSPENNFAEIPNDRVIYGKIFLDYDDNGTEDGNDHGIAGQIVNLSGTDINGNAVTDSVTTGVDGSYQFTGLPAGTYTVTEPDQPTSTDDGKTSCITTGCNKTAQGTTPSIISNILLTGLTMVSPENNFPEVPHSGGGINPAPNLTLAKSHSPSLFVAGSNTGFYTLTPSNIGTVDTSSTITIVDTLPAGITAVGIPGGTGWYCNVAGQTITCTTDTVIASQTAGNPIRIVVAVSAALSGQMVTNNAVVSGGGEPDSYNGNNSASDIAFVFTFDFADAPDTGVGSGIGNYKTLSTDGGAGHILGFANAPYLGKCVDSDNGHLQNIRADADDNDAGLAIGTCVDDKDEDGVVINRLLVGEATTIEVTASSGTNDCTLNAWVDFNHDGDFNDVINGISEQISINRVIGSGNTDTININVPDDAFIGYTYARFRCSTDTNLTPNGLASNGEVEDYRIFIETTPDEIAMDFGDAPAGKNYSTTHGSEGPSHILGVANAPYLGQCVDSDDGNLNNNNANSDDLTDANDNKHNLVVGQCRANTKSNKRAALGLGDEDGVYFRTPFVQGKKAYVHVTSSANTSDCKLDAWVDFSGDGDFIDVNEQIANTLNIPAGTTIVIEVDVPSNATTGDTYSRFRCSTAGGLSPTGPAPDGEVEDYHQPEIIASTVTKSIEVTATPICFKDSPWLEYEITPIGFTPDNLATISWKKMDGSNVSLLPDQGLSGRLLWPGAEVDASGAAVSWPGWRLENGQWVVVDDGLRPELILDVSVNPENGIVVSYPPVTAQCNASSPRKADPKSIPTLNIYSMMLMILFLMAIVRYKAFIKAESS